MKRQEVSAIESGLGSAIREININAGNYRKWTAFEVASLLVDPVIGADLEVHKVALLIPLLKDKNWIHTIINYSTDEEALRNIKEKVTLLGKEEQIILATTVEVCISFLRQTFTKYIHSNAELHISLVRFSDRFVPVAPGILPYENNKGTVKSMGRTLVKNINLHKTGTIRNQTLLVNSDYFGSGKTRLGIEFLSLWKKQLDKEERDWLVNHYLESSVSQLENSQLVYIDCRSLTVTDNDLEKTLKNLKGQIELYIGGEVENTPCFIILDEIGVFISSYLPQEAQLYQYHYHFTSMYLFLQKFFLPLQKIPTVSLYVCGKGAFLEVIGKLSPTLPSPTLISKINLTPLSIENIRNILNILEKEQFSSFISKLKELSLFELYLEQLFEETKGVPFFVDHYVLESRQSNLNSDLDIMHMFGKIRNELPEGFSSPFNQFTTSPTTLAIYKSLLFAGLLSLPINLSSFSIEFGLDLKNTEFEGLGNLNYLDVALMLNCYLQKIPDTDNYLLLFPKAIIKSMLKSPLTHPIPILGPIVDKYKEMLPKGDVFEHLIGSTLSFCLKWGSLQRLNIGDTIPFLKDTVIGTTMCKPLNIVNLKTKLLSEKKNFITGYLQSLKILETGSIGTFFDHSHSPDHIWKAGTFVGIQDKNKTHFSFSELKEEIDKIEKLRMAIAFQKSNLKQKAKMTNFETIDTSIRLLILLFYRCECIGLKKEKVYTESISVGSETISLLENCSVVIVDGDATKLFLGKENIDALEALSTFKSKK